MVFLRKFPVPKGWPRYWQSAIKLINYIFVSLSEYRTNNKPLHLIFLTHSPIPAFVIQESANITEKHAAFLGSYTKNYQHYCEHSRCCYQQGNIICPLHFYSYFDHTIFLIKHPVTMVLYEQHLIKALLLSHLFCKGY